MSRAEFVRIDEDALRRFAHDVVASAPIGSSDKSALDRNDAAPVDDVEVNALLVFALDAINFGSGYHDIVRKRPGLSGAVTMSTSLTEYVDRTGPLTGARLRAMTPADCSQIFGQELDGGASGELMERFATALNDLGEWLLPHNDHALAAIDSSDHQAETLVEMLTAMPYFRDVEVVDGLTVHLYKRAQITVADLSRKLPSIEFHGLDRLTAFADNLVPHVLRVDGVLEFDRGLEAKINTKQRLEPGSRAEVEIRAAGVVVVEHLAALSGHRPMDIDARLWTMGGQPRYKAIPRHRARSVYY